MGDKKHIEYFKYNWRTISEEQMIELFDKIEPLDEEVMALARQRQMELAKPPGSLGKLEDISIQLAGITGNVKNYIKKQCIAIMSADNGVIEEGVASAPQYVTVAQTINFTRRLTGVGSLARYFDVDLLVLDMGINNKIPAGLLAEEIYKEKGRIADKIVNRKIGMGTKNLAKGAAMDREDAVCAIAAGIEAASKIKEFGYDIFGIGEMGICNTTTSSSVLSALLGLTAEETVGKGGGLTLEGFEKKKKVVEDALKLHGLYQCTEPVDVIDVLAKVGGFDIAAMTGAFIGAALYKLPVVIDGYISIVAALCASRLAPLSKEYMIASHTSWEVGYNYAVKELGVSPMLNLNMRLGEGSGCPIAFKVIEASCGVMNYMGTFAEAEINDKYLDEIRKGDCF